MLFAAVLGREPAPVAVDYWGEVVRAEGGEATAAHLLHQPEVLASNRSVASWYRSVLRRDPDAEGLAFWRSVPAEVALWGIASSVEAGCGWTDPAPVYPPGWVDLGHGVWGPAILAEIRWCESRDDYGAANPTSSARGAYQFLRSSWKNYGHAESTGVRSADQATPAEQDAAAVATWQRSGARPWNPSRSCWS